jgi:2-oxopent-4-enoate/cis-2-oxohex-4-enoate hydratase
VTEAQILDAAAAIFEAARTRTPMAPLREQYPGITIDDAYRISRSWLALRLAAGEALVGKKIGVTSAPVQDFLGVHQPDFGFLTDAMAYPNGGEMPIGELLIQPKAEGELAFVLARDLVGPGVTEADVLAATAAVRPCFEIVDSRVRDWKIGIEDTVADNASCGLYCLGAPVSPAGLDFPALRMRVTKNGQPLSEGVGAAALGDPLTCVAWLANTLGAYGIRLEAGDLVLSGSWVPLEPVTPGDVMSLTIDGVGSASVRFV